jgi:hypothetical protein
MEDNGITDEEIFEAMLANDTDVKMPPVKEFKVFLKFKVERGFPSSAD